MNEKVIRYESFIFNSMNMVNLLKACVMYLSDYKLKIDIRHGRSTNSWGNGLSDEKDIYFYPSDNKKHIIMLKQIWRGIKIKENCFWFENGDVNKYDFERNKEMQMLLSTVYNELSKNEKKEYQKLYKRLIESITYKRIQNYLNFLYEKMNINYSTSYGFDGGDIVIKEIHPYDELGHQKELNNIEIRKNKNEIKEIKRRLEFLEQRNESLLEKVKNNKGLLLS